MSDLTGSIILLIAGRMTQPQTGKKSKVKSYLLWAIPVPLVIIVLCIALVVMVAKYRSLQRSFMAFANRGYARAEEEDDDVAVTFHQGNPSFL